MAPARRTLVANAHLRAESDAEHRRRAHDLALAGEIQRRMLPSTREMTGIRVAAEYRPAFGVGGDFYDLVPHPGGEMTAVIGDVAGNGIAAALVMSRVSSELRRLAQQSMPLHALLAQLNQMLLAQFSDDTFVTAACLRIDASRRLVTVANAGHIVPLLRHAHGGVDALGDSAGPPLGIFAHPTFTEEQFELASGDILILSTDGVLDALAADGQELARVVTDAPADVAAIPQRVLGVLDSAGTPACADDITLLALEVRNEPSTLAA